VSGDTYPWWWEVDLGNESIISDVQLSWWMIGGSEATEEFTISVSDDGLQWKVAYSDLHDTQYGFNDCPVPSVEARYVRVTGYSAPTQNRGTTWYVPQIYEARVGHECAQLGGRHDGQKAGQLPAPGAKQHRELSCEWRLPAQPWRGVGGLSHRGPPREPWARHPDRIQRPPELSY